MFEGRERRSPASGGFPFDHVPATGDIHLLDRLSAVYRHRRLVAAVFVLVVTALMLQSYSMIPLWRAQARLLIEDERTTMIHAIEVTDPVFWADPAPYYETQYRIMASRGLAQQTLRRLDLSEVPDFSGQRPEPQFALAVVRSVRLGLVRAVFPAFSGVTGLLHPKPRAALPERTADEEETRGTSAEERALIDAFIARIQVAPVINTRLVDVYFTSADPVFAAAALNAHIETYVEENLARRLQQMHKTLEWLEAELVKQQTLVEDSERAMAEYREIQNALSLEDANNIVGARLAQLNDAVTRAGTTRRQKESLFDQVTGVDPTSDEAVGIPAVAQHPSVQEAKQRLISLDADLAKLSARYLPRHPEIIRLTGSIESARQQLKVASAQAIQSIRSDYASAVNEEAKLQIDLEQQKNAAMELSRKGVGYSVLEREAESNRRVYESLLQQQKALQVLANSRANNVQIMDRAVVPGQPFAPNVVRDWFVALLVGLMLSIGLVVVVEYLDDTIKTPDDIMRRLRVPMLGLLPAVRGRRAPLLPEPAPHDFGEAFRSLRTSLVFTAGRSHTRIVAITSTQPLEGKTTSACNLAMVLAVGGARVLLIDADMRRPSLHALLGVHNAVGLSHVLVGQARVREAIQKTHDGNVFALAAGQPPPNPSELLASDRMKTLLSHLETGPFDWVIIDTPPVLAVTDAAVVAPSVSGVVFVVGAEMTRSGHAERALAMLRGSGNPHIIGAVLNRVDFHRNKFYYSRYYGYQYCKRYDGAQTTASASPHALNKAGQDAARQSLTAISPGTIRRVRGSLPRNASQPANPRMPMKMAHFIASARRVWGRTAHSSHNTGCARHTAQTDP